MGREQHSAPEKSTREQRRTTTLQLEYSLLGAFLGALVGTADLSSRVMILFAVILGFLLFVTNRYWERIHEKIT